jgi:hypothetical protein
VNSFEYITVLVSIVVGLAIADIANSVHRLLAAGRRVTWDWISLVAALLILLELLNLWWKWHGFTGSTLGEVLPYFGVLFLLFLAAAVSLPDHVPAEGINLRDYFVEKRRHFWAVYAAYVTGWIGLRTLELYQSGQPLAEVLAGKAIDYITIVAYVALVFVRSPIISGLALLVTLVWLAFDWWELALGAMR